MKGRNIIRKMGKWSPNELSTLEDELMDGQGAEHSGLLEIEKWCETGVSGTHRLGSLQTERIMGLFFFLTNPRLCTSLWPIFKWTSFSSLFTLVCWKVKKIQARAFVHLFVKRDLKLRVFFSDPFLKCPSSFTFYNFIQSIWNKQARGKGSLAL